MTTEAQAARVTSPTGVAWEAVGHDVCAELPIHIPGAIQGHGWLLAFDLASRRVSHLSANLVGPASTLIGANGLAGAGIEHVVAALGLPTSVGSMTADTGHLVDLPWLSAGPVVLTARLASEHYVVELEPKLVSVADSAASALGKLVAASSWQQFAEQMVETLAGALGYDRAMAYVFHSDMHGEVVAERIRQPSLEPFLGLHYPATDIPPRARRLYVLQPVRIIADVDAPTVDLLGSPNATGTSATDLDLTFCDLRAVAPVHLRYLQNMGVAATAAMSVLQIDELAAMFVMHHSTPRWLSWEDRQTLLTLSRVASFVWSTMVEKAAIVRRLRLNRVVKELRDHLIAGAGAVQSLAEIGADAFQALEADGLIVRSGADAICLGDTPDCKIVDHAVRQLSAGAEQLVVVSSNLSKDLPGIAVPHTCAGALIGRMPGGLEAYVAWFRREQLATIRWGGDPTTLVGRDESGQLHPRGSFAAFVEKVTGRSQEWTVLDRDAARVIYQTVQSGLLEHEYNGLASLAAVDSLTGLGNRRALDFAIETRSATVLRPLGLLFLDLDRFKQINDSFGHDYGDLVLKAATARLARVVRSEAGAPDSVFRLGGDEFVVLLPNAGPSTVIQIAERILEAFRLPFDVDGTERMLNISIGAVADLSGTVSSTELLRRGDLAMYAAKRDGGSRVVSYSDDLSKVAVKRTLFEREIQKAMKDGEFAVFYQPVVSMRARQIVGAEALVRWRHPVRGLIEPAEFVGFAEATGQLGDIDRWILAAAIGECIDLLRDPDHEFQLAVNVSVMTMGEDYVSLVADQIERHGFAPGRLTVEITESAFVGEALLNRGLEALRKIGVKVSIDDFGTGYSSLSYLHSLPADVVKLDQTFVKRLTDGASGQSVARWALQLVQDLGLPMIAEGVETAEQESILVSIGYDWAQGYLYGKPMAGPPRTGLVTATTPNRARGGNAATPNP